MNMIKKRTRNYCAPQTAGVYSLEYNPMAVPHCESPIAYEHTGGGSNYLVARLDGQEYFYEPEGGWYSLDANGLEIEVGQDSELETALSRLMHGSFCSMINEMLLARVTDELPQFLVEKNLSIFFCSDENWANKGEYYVVEGGREIDQSQHPDFDRWANIMVSEKPEAHIRRVAVFVLGLSRDGCYKTILIPQYKNKNV